MVNKTLYSIFKKGSKTYFYSSLFFPGEVKHDVFCLYAFVRKADNFVDTLPQDKEGFYAFCDQYYHANQGIPSGDIVIDSFIKLKEEKSFQDEWVTSFLTSMGNDLIQKTYVSLDDVKEYMYGSAEVIGLFMAKLIGLPRESYRYARLLARSMQYINFIRDIKEDSTLGRTYLPQEIVKQWGLENLTYDHARNHPDSYGQFIRGEVERYCHWQHEAEKGYRYIPKRYLIPIKTASEMYKWTAYQIYKDPFIVYEKKVKPPLYHILTGIITSTLGKYYMRPCPENRDLDV
jgi:phytoene synthase